MCASPPLGLLYCSFRQWPSPNVDRSPGLASYVLRPRLRHSRELELPNSVDMLSLGQEIRHKASEARRIWHTPCPEKLDNGNWGGGRVYGVLLEKAIGASRLLLPKGPPITIEFDYISRYQRASSYSCEKKQIPDSNAGSPFVNEI